MGSPVTVLGTTVIWPTTGDVGYSANALQLQTLLAAAVAPIANLYNPLGPGGVGNLGYSNSGELLLNGLPVSSGGTVTSVGVSSTDLSVSGSPVTTSGTITLNLNNTSVTPGVYTNADITVDAKGRITAAANGSSGLPAGSNTEIQFNNAGAFGASSNLTWNGTALGVSGNLSITGASRLIQSDFSNATPANRTYFQTSTTNGNSFIGSRPNGTAVEASYYVENNSTVGNNAGMSMATNSTRNIILSYTRGSGTLLPLQIGMGLNIVGEFFTNGSTSIGQKTSLATTATDGFLYTRSMAGVPTGVPTTVTGQVPITFDTTNNNMYFYSGGAWQTPSGSGGTVTSVAVAGTAGQISSSGGPITTSGTITLALENTAVTPASYTNANITVDAKGRITSASNGSTGVTSVSASAPLASSGGATPNITITQATTSTNGFLSSTDWNTFNSKGSGSVTSVAASGSNGVSISGSPITTSGTLTIGLGAITPTSVAASGTVTGSNLSGTNTGDQTITLTGDVTGSGTGSFGTTLANTAVTPGAYTNANITVDAKGRITSAANGSAGGVTSVGASAPIASSGGATPTISISQATTSTDGYLSSTDWNTFNNKGSGSVTSVNVNGTSGRITSSGSPITTSGTITMDLATTAVTPGSYTNSNITVDAYGRITAASNGSGGSSPLTTKGDLYTYSTLDTRLPVGTNGQTLVADSAETTGLKWINPYPIGTILTAPSAPLVGGTWLECDGSGVSQATYSALFAEIGHAWCNYKVTYNSGTAPATPGNTHQIVWTGTKWVWVQSGNTQTYTSTDGLTWTAAGTLPATVSNPVVRVGNSDEVVVHASGSTSVSYGSTNGGTTWGTNTALPATAIWTSEFNGTDWLLVPSSGTTIYSTTNPFSGSWSTHTSVLAANPGAGATLFWDGTNWILFATGATVNVIQKTSVSNGSSGWSSPTTLRRGASINSAAMLKPDGTIAYYAAGAANNFTLTQDSFTTVTEPRTPPLNPIIAVGTTVVAATWNGFAFVVIPLLSPNIMTSVDGINWNILPNKMSIAGGTTIWPGIGWQFNGTGVGSRSSVNKTNGKMPYVYTSTDNIAALLEPVTDLTVNFCLPDFIETSTRWIRAL